MTKKKILVTPPPPPPLSKTKTKCSIFKQCAFEYLRCSQIHGYKFIMAKDRPFFERTYWATIALSIISLTMGLIISGYLHFVRGPTVTSEQVNGFPILNMPFPAVGVCSSNRISRKALMEFSKFILNATENSSIHVGRTLNEVYENLLPLGNIYNFELDYDEYYYKMDRTHNVLKYVYSGLYPINEILSSLTPKCEEIIKSCKWQGKIVNCTALFSSRKTYMGNCCLFNYQRSDLIELKYIPNAYKDDHQHIDIQPLRVKKHGTDFGLAVIVDTMPDDYAYMIDSFIGTKVLIFDTQNFPDIYSGALQERILKPEEEMFLTFHPVVINGSGSMKQFNAASRHCVFTDEINLIYKDFYTLSECLLTCVLKNIVKYCGCYPPQYTNLFNSSECLLDDLSCLRRWKIEWLNVEAVLTSDRPRVEAEYHCPKCFSRCNTIRYRIQDSNAFFDPKTVHLHGHDPSFVYNLNLTNHSIFYVNFGNSKVEAYEQTIQYLWYELLANFGGLTSLTFGASIMSIIELIYFATGKFGTICLKRYNGTLPVDQNAINNRREKKRNAIGFTNSPKAIQQLYWNEFKIKAHRRQY